MHLFRCGTGVVHFANAIRGGEAQLPEEQRQVDAVIPGGFDPASRGRMEQAAPGASELLRCQREKFLHTPILARTGWRATR